MILSRTVDVIVRFSRLYVWQIDYDYCYGEDITGEDISGEDISGEDTITGEVTLICNCILFL